MHVFLTFPKNRYGNTKPSISAVSTITCYFCIICVNSTLWDVLQLLTHWGRVTHICVGNLTIIGSENGLSPGRRQAIIWTNFREILTEIITFSFKKMYLKMSSANCHPFRLGLNVLRGLTDQFHKSSHPYHRRSDCLSNKPIPNLPRDQETTNLWNLLVISYYKRIP